MSSSIPLQIAETIQTASINRSPDPAYDLNPSTAASSKQPVTVSHHTPKSDTSHELDTYDEVAGIDEDEEGEEEEDDIPYDIVRPLPRRASLPPLPDLRFEQSYLASIAGAETYSRVAYITIRDQILLPLVQGTLWSLALHGWRFWNRNTQLSGSSVGARIRRWWWRTNNWPIEQRGNAKGFFKNTKYAADLTDYYELDQGAGGG